MSSVKVTTAREAAARLTDEAGAEMGADGLEPIRKRLLGALFETAFPEAAPRGPAYPEEQEDIEHWLTSNAKVHEEDSANRLLATAGAWVAGERGPSPEVLAVVRALAVYFLQSRASTVADILTEETRIFPGKDGAT